MKKKAMEKGMALDKKERHWIKRNGNEKKRNGNEKKEQK